MLDLRTLLDPVTPDAPCGTNLEYSPEYAEFERALQGTPERHVGDKTLPGEEPDWADVIEKGVALLRASKDLRIATALARACLKRDGFHGFAGGLSLVRGLVENHWAGVFPRLDEDDHDPTARVNALATLTHRDTLNAVRGAPLIASKASGVVTLRDVEGSDPAFQALPFDELNQAARDVEACDAEARALEVAWTQQLESSGPDFLELRRLLAQARQVMKTHVEHRQPTAPGGSPASRPAPAAAGAPMAAFGGEVRSRDDVVRALDGICAYYARHEPSSPVPLLVERCKRLVTMSFLDIVKDMVPDGLATIQTITGKSDD